MPLRYWHPLNQNGGPACFGDLPNGNYTCFDTNGWLQSRGDGRSWVDFNFGVGALNRGAAAPDLISLGATNIETLGFNGVNTLEQVSAVVEMNHNWAESTIIKPHVHWYPTTNGAGNVMWQLEYAVVGAGDTVPASTTITVTQAAGGVAWASFFAAFPDIDLAGFTIGAQMHLRLFRDPTIGADTYGADAALATFGLHVLVDSFGSRLPATK